ncbi:MAG: hypothetical protein DRI71_00640 [Bacteroidetes bacterium]|nr:MAG: hypothetical protein DRI71_00640 [Bacteroidota bacterium]
MTRKISLILTGLMFLAFTGFAQDYTFRVMVSKGENKVKVDGGDWKTLRIGEKLNSGDQLQVPENGYLGMVHSSGQTKELKTAGDYSISELSSAISANTQNIASKYADFVISKMSPEEKEANRRKYASVTGAVERGDSDASINIFMPTSVSVYNPEVMIRWDGVAGENTTYVVKLKDLFEQTIMVAETSETSYTIDFNDAKLANAIVENLVIVNVSVKGNEDLKSKNAAIQQFSTDATPSFEVELKALKANLGAQSSINNLILAEFYEENDLLLDALTSYEYAIKMSPDVEYYKEAYDEFLLRNGLK